MTKQGSYARRFRVWSPLKLPRVLLIYGPLDKESYMASCPYANESGPKMQGKEGTKLKKGNGQSTRAINRGQGHFRVEQGQSFCQENMIDEWH